MYKVFIDNKPIIFITKRNLGALPSIDFATIVHSVGALKQILSEKTNLSQCIFVVCIDPKLSRDYFFSDYQVVPAAGGIVQREDEFLFIKRLGLWDIPKGKIESGEKTKIAAMREIEEECGIANTVILSKLLNTYHTYTFKNKKSIKKTTWYHLSYEGNKMTQPQAEEDIEEAKWFKRTDFDFIKQNTYASIKNVIETLEIELDKNT